LRSIFGVTQDVTERDKVENELRESQARLRDFAEASAEHYWQTDARHRYDYFSSSYQESSDRSNEGLLGQPVENATDAIFRNQEPWQFIQSQIRRQQAFRDVVFERQGAKPGETVWIRASGKPYYNENGEFQGFRGTSTNVTAHLALQEQLAQAQKMETVGQLTGGVAHDFNNLLAVIIGNAELLLRRGDLAAQNSPDGNKAERSVDAILRSAYRGAELTQQLLAFSRKQALSPKVIILNKQVGGMIAMLRRSLDARIEIETRSSDDLWPCLADPGQLENVVLNLAINARDAMPGGGTLSFETANAYLDENSAAQADVNPGAYVTLAVTDTGTGMPAEVRDHIFEPFFTTKDQGKGTGLGLSMVFGFVKQSNGHVTVDSEEGHGTTVKLYLPRAMQQPSDAENHEAKQPGAHGECILVVEDDPDVRNLAVNLLGDLGYRVLEAGDGKAAVGILAREQHIDLLFTDVILTGAMNGNDIARHAHSHHPDIKIMYMSGYSHDALIHQGRLEDAVVLLQKPFSRAELAVKLREALENPPEGGKAAAT
jgi:PAS domain S-box-containing protein